MRLCLSNLCAILALAGCGNKPGDAPATQPPVATKPDAAAPPPAPTPPPIGLTLTSPGAEPRNLIRYGNSKPLAFTLTFDTETATKTGNLVSPTIVITGTMTPTIEGASGQLRFDIASVTAVDRERQLVDAAGINYYLRGYKPPTFVLGVTAGGDLSPDESNWKFPDMMFNQDQALHDILAKWAPVFPDVAIGPGAVWTQVKNDIVQRVALVRTSEVRLVPSDDATKATDQAHVEISFSETAAPQRATIGDMPLEIISYQATGIVSHDYSKQPGVWLGQTTGTSTTTLVYNHRDKQETIVRKTTWSLAPATKARKR